jgi:symplekin
MATAVPPPPFDPLATLSAALSAPVDSQQQADSLKTLRDHLESHPNAIPVLCVPLLQNTAGTEETIFKRWVLDLLHFALHSPALSLDVRTQRESGEE